MNSYNFCNVCLCGSCAAVYIHVCAVTVVKRVGVQNPFQQDSVGVSRKDDVQWMNFTLSFSQHSDVVGCEP